MAYRRRHGMSRASTFQEDAKRPPLDPLLTTSYSFSGLSPTNSVAGQPIPDTAPPGQTSPWAADTDFGSPRSKVLSLAFFRFYENSLLLHHDRIDLVCFSGSDYLAHVLVSVSMPTKTQRMDRKGFGAFWLEKLKRFWTMMTPLSLSSWEHLLAGGDQGCTIHQTLLIR